jgi:hypothetical protein
LADREKEPGRSTIAGIGRRLAQAEPAPGE